MKSSTLYAKLATVLMLGVAAGLWIHHTHVESGQLGREAFLVHEGQRFDKFFAKPLPTLAGVFAGTVGVGILVGAYELMATVLAKILEALGGPR
jgi:hypothetical protein